MQTFTPLFLKTTCSDAGPKKKGGDFSALRTYFIVYYLPTAGGAGITFINSTSKTSVAFGGITPPAPPGP